MHTIVVPLDGSPLAEQVLPYARALAALTDARLHLIQVVHEDAVNGPFMPTIAETYATGSEQTVQQAHERAYSWETLSETANVYLSRQVQALHAAGGMADSEALLDEPADAIISVAGAAQAAYIAMATHGRSGLKRWALGSVADKVLHATETPLLLVRAQDA